MATSYDNIHNRAIRKISDRDLLSMSASNLADTLDGFLDSAIVNFNTAMIDLSDKDDTLRQFNETLTAIEEEIIALYEVVEWITPQLNNIDLIKMNLSTKDYKLTSQANHLEKLRGLFEESVTRAKRLQRDYKWRTASLDDLV